MPGNSALKLPDHYRHHAGAAVEPVGQLIQRIVVCLRCGIGVLGDGLDIFGIAAVVTHGRYGGQHPEKGFSAVDKLRRQVGGCFIAGLESRGFFFDLIDHVLCGAVFLRDQGCEYDTVIKGVHGLLTGSFRLVVACVKALQNHVQLIRIPTFPVKLLLEDHKTVKDPGQRDPTLMLKTFFGDVDRLQAIKNGVELVGFFLG